MKQWDRFWDWFDQPGNGFWLLKLAITVIVASLLFMWKWNLLRR